MKTLDNTINIENFRSIKSIQIEIGAITVLIGANNSGKTNILDAIKFQTDSEDCVPLKYIKTCKANIIIFDNIDQGILDIARCKSLIPALYSICIKHKKKIVLSTHNPVILDGLNLHNEDQKLFSVYKNDYDETSIKQIKFKPVSNQTNRKYLLSELWIRGYLGAIEHETTHL